MTGRIICAESGAGKSTLAAKSKYLLDTDDLFRVWCVAQNRDGWEILRDPESYANFATCAVRFYAPRVLTGGWLLTWDPWLARRIAIDVANMTTIEPDPPMTAYAYHDTKDLLSAKHEQYVSKNPPKDFRDDEAILAGHRHFLESVLEIGMELQWIPKGKHLEDVL